MLNVCVCVCVARGGPVGLPTCLLLGGDVVIDEGHPLIGPLAPHTGDPGHRHLAGLDGGLGAVAAKLRLFLFTQGGVERLNDSHLTQMCKNSRTAMDTLDCDQLLHFIQLKMI